MTIEIQPEQSVEDFKESPEPTPPENEAPPSEGEPPALERGTPPEPPADEWQPDLSYKVREEQKKMDEALLGVIDSKEREEYFRGLYTKADGLDHVKQTLVEKAQEYEDLTKKHSSLDHEHSQFKEGLGKLAKLREQDFMAFQRHWQIPDKQILERAQQILELDEKGLDAQREHERQFEQRQYSYQNEAKLQQESARSQATAQELHQVKLQQALAAPDIASFRTDYNKRLGDGAFEAAVDDYGSLQYHKSKRYVDPQVAVAEVFKRNKALFQSNQPVPDGEAPPEGTPPKRLPNLGQGRTGTRVRSRIKTMDDLIKYRDSLMAGKDY